VNCLQIVTFTINGTTDRKRMLNV